VYYEGTQSILGDAFQSCSSLKNVCVPPDYDSESFCGAVVSKTSQICIDYQNLFNHCSKAVFVDNGFAQVKRENASEWERKTTLCIEYTCVDDFGPNQTVLVQCEDGPSCFLGACNGLTGECEYPGKEQQEELVAQNNQCYDVVCDEDSHRWVFQKNTNATEWEKRMNGCFEYKCDNVTGLFHNNICETSDNSVHECVNDTCIVKAPPSDKDWSVEIELQEGVTVNDMNVTDVLETIRLQCGIDTASVTVAWESDEKGNIIRIILYLEDEDEANKLSVSVNKMEKGKGCEFGVLCKSKLVTVVPVQMALSHAQIPQDMVLVLIMSFIIMSVSILF